METYRKHFLATIFRAHLRAARARLASVQNVVRFLQTQIAAPSAVVRSRAVHHTPRDCVGGALVLQPPHVGGQLRAVAVPLVPEVAQVSVGVPRPEVLGGADIQENKRK